MDILDRMASGVAECPTTTWTMSPMMSVEDIVNHMYDFTSTEETDNDNNTNNDNTSTSDNSTTKTNPMTKSNNAPTSMVNYNQLKMPRPHNNTDDVPYHDCGRNSKPYIQKHKYRRKQQEK